MRRMRPSVSGLGWAAALLIGFASRADAQWQDAYAGTLYDGTGLIDIPVAWVSPTSADAWVTTSAKYLPSAPKPSAQSMSSLINTNISIETHWFGRVAVGASAYSQNPDGGFFGRLLLLRDGQFGPLPALAFGVRNLGPDKHEDRFFIAHDITLDSATGYKGTFDPRYKKFHTAPSFYGVATKELTFGAPSETRMPTTLSLTLGWGNGVFSQDGGLGKAYNDRGQVAPGLFFGVRSVLHPSLNTSVSLLAENNGWDYNAGVLGDWRGLQLGLYGSELEEGGRDAFSKGFYVYNYTKWNVTLGYSGNILDIARGVILRTRITGLMREQLRLRAEIAERERHIHALNLALDKLQASDLASLAAKRGDLQAQVNEEREAIEKAQQRLNDIQEGKLPAPGVSPTPPSTPNTTTSPSATPAPATPPTTTPPAPAGSTTPTTPSTTQTP